MMNCFKVDKYVLICCFIGSILISPIVCEKGDTFCEQNIDIYNKTNVKIFTMGANTYLIDGEDIYTTKIGQTFKGQTAKDENEVFSTTIGFGVMTGFFVSAIPDCADNSTKCENWRKLDQMGFIIGSINGTNIYQPYIAFRFNGEQIEPIHDNTEMPFGMDAQGVIQHMNKIWPIPSGSGLLYVASTYDQREYSFIHIIELKTGPMLFMKWLPSDLTTTHTINDTYGEPRISIIENFNGFVKRSDSDGHKIIAMISTNASDIYLVDIRYNKKSDIKDTTIDFPEQSKIQLNDIYGCYGTGAAAGSISSSTPEPISEKVSPTTDRSTVPTDEISAYYKTLIWVSLGICISGGILLMALIAVVVYLQNKLKKRDEQQVVQKPIILKK